MNQLNNENAVNPPEVLMKLSKIRLIASMPNSVPLKNASIMDITLQLQSVFCLKVQIF